MATLTPLSLNIIGYSALTALILHFTRKHKITASAEIWEKIIEKKDNTMDHKLIYMQDKTTTT